jgi:HK97 gp10 family phage protein
MADTQTLKGLDDVLDKLKRLPPEIVSKNGGPVKTALRKGAMVIVNEWKAQVQRVIDEPNADGQPTDSTGLLKSSIGATRDSKPQRHGANERYIVRVRNKKYPVKATTSAPAATSMLGSLFAAAPKKKPPPPTTSQVARLLEYGTEKMQAKPWATPGYMASRQRALNTVVSELNAGIDRVIKKLSRMK